MDGGEATSEPDADRGGAPPDGGDDGPPEQGAPLLIPGETCWRIERATHFSIFVDAAGYFATLKRAVLRAQRRGVVIRLGVAPPAPPPPPPRRPPPGQPA